MKNLMTNISYYIVATVGGGNITVGDPATKINDLNKLFISAGVGVGMVLLVIGVIKLIMSIADESPKGKMDASAFLGVSVFFLGLSTVVNTLKVTSGSTVTSVTSKVVTILGTICGYAGIALLAVTIIMIILAFSQENADAMSKASTTAGVAIGLLSAKTLASTINSRILGSVASGRDASGAFASIVIDFIAGVSGYIGITLIPLGVFKLVYGIRNEDSADRNSAIKIMAVGATFTAIKGVFAVFGL